MAGRNPRCKYQRRYNGSFGVVVCVFLLVLFVCSYFYETFSIALFVLCLSEAVTLCCVNSHPETLVQKKCNLAISLLMYFFTLAALLNQGVCNITGLGCPFYVNPDSAISRLILISCYSVCLIIHSLSVFWAAQIVFSHDSASEEDETCSNPEVEKPPLRFPVIEMHVCENNFDLKECIICQYTFSASSLVMQLPCGHIYHNDCLIQWYSRSILCPMCRQPIVGPDIHARCRAEATNTTAVAIV
mmetsp:Transcript_13870/g.17201  ORF Transcript_13870/g.17201 Transcript_13870/m.17201 type:complete len:244 (-) Transcript_13870:1332-2063(-)